LAPIPRNRDLNPVADNDGKGFESFRVKDPDGFDVQIGNINGLVKARKTPAAAKLEVELPSEATNWRTVWLDHFSFGAGNYKPKVCYYTNLIRWKGTYDEGSQEEADGRRRRCPHPWKTEDSLLPLAENIVAENHPIVPQIA
jgi:hypothetical protein